MKLTNTSESKQLYRMRSREVRKIAKKKKKEYRQRKLEELEVLRLSNPREFWKRLRDLNGSNTSQPLPDSLVYEGSVETPGEEFFRS